MLRSVLAVCAATLAIPAIAQDLEAQYASAFHAFTVTGQSGSYFLQPQGVIANLLPTLTGQWLDALTISGYTDGVDAAYLAEQCADAGLAVVTIEAVSPNSFSVTKGGEDNLFTTTYTHLGLNWFQGSFDPNALAAYLQVDVDNQMVANAIVQNEQFLGLYTPGPDVLVMLPAGGMPQIRTRCPT